MILPVARRLRFAAALGVVVLLAGSSAISADATTPTKKGKRRRPHRTFTAPPAVPRPPDPFRVTLATADGVELVGSFRPVPGQADAPAVLLLHAFSRDRREFEERAGDLTARGLATLALDLRGHGESIRRRDGRKVPLVPSLQSDPNAFPRDVEAACAWLRQRSPRVGVLGLSLSGDLAVLATASGWADAAVAVSANADQLPALAGSRPTVPRATLVLASESDPGRAESARALDRAGLSPKSLSLYPGAAHALDLLVQRPEAWKAAVGWLGELLGAVPPPVPVVPVPSPTPGGPP